MTQKCVLPQFHTDPTVSRMQNIHSMFRSK